MEQKTSHLALAGVKNVLWDWNGTLLNDCDICVDIINELLHKHGYKTITTEKYQQIFTFPVKDYYKAAGFNFRKNPFEEVAVEFMDLYRDRITAADIFPEVFDLLEAFKAMGFGQYIISAMEHTLLVQTLKDKKLYTYFNGISGIQNDLAFGKKEMAINFVDDMKIDAESAVFIGDTIHDQEVAIAIGTPCLLVASGHQSFERLDINGNWVVRFLPEIMQYFA